MIPAFRLACCGLALLLYGACASSKLGQYTDYSLAVGQAYPAEQAAAQKRMDRYLAHLKPAEKERLANVEYIAVEATSVPVGEGPGGGNRIFSRRARGGDST